MFALHLWAAEKLHVLKARVTTRSLHTYPLKSFSRSKAFHFLSEAAKWFTAQGRINQNFDHSNQFRLSQNLHSQKVSAAERSLAGWSDGAGAVSVVVASDFDERERGLRKRESERASERAAPRSELRIAVRVAQRSLTQSHRDRGSATDGSNRKTLEEVDLLPACHLLDRFLRLKQQLLGLEGEVSFGSVNIACFAAFPSRRHRLEDFDIQ